MLLKEVGKLREDKRALQQYVSFLTGGKTGLKMSLTLFSVLYSELGTLLCLKSKYSAGGEFEPDWYVSSCLCEEKFT